MLLLVAWVQIVRCQASSDCSVWHWARQCTVTSNGCCFFLVLKHVQISSIFFRSQWVHFCPDGSIFAQDPLPNPVLYTAVTNPFPMYVCNTPATHPKTPLFKKKLLTKKTPTHPHSTLAERLGLLPAASCLLASGSALANAPKVVFIHLQSCSERAEV